MNLALDMMGGDFAPLEAIKGLKLYLKDSDGKATVYCIGDKQQIEA
ncbi:MAG TPA: phosphate--acyl-ACP acyltransferase, partial [Chitinophagaceae bacterium]